MDDDEPAGGLGPFEVEPIEAKGAGKVRGPLADSLADVDADQLLSAIVKVNEPGYVPEAADNRARISDTLFTANVRRAGLEALEEDPRVESVELNERLDQID